MREIHPVPSETLGRFILPDAEVTEDIIDLFKGHYGIDIVGLNSSELGILVNYAKNGAAATIMDLIARISLGKDRILNIKVDRAGEIEG